jgi:CHAT domain-containing protein
MKKELMSDVAKKITNKYQEKEFMNTKKIKEKELVDNMDEEQLVIYNFIEKKLKPFADIAKERRNKDYF